MRRLRLGDRAGATGDARTAAASAAEAPPALRELDLSASSPRPSASAAEVDASALLRVEGLARRLRLGGRAVATAGLTACSVAAEEDPPECRVTGALFSSSSEVASSPESKAASRGLFDINLPAGRGTAYVVSVRCWHRRLWRRTRQSRIGHVAFGWCTRSWTLLVCRYAEHEDVLRHSALGTGYN